MNMISSRTQNDKQCSQSDNQVGQKMKNPLNHLQSNGLIDKYLPQSQLLKKCLPAGFSQQPIYGQLMLNFSPIVFDSTAPISKSKHVIYRCHMLGYNKNQQPLFSNQITYTIHTNNKMFKNYLKDMKICIVDILDARNYETIGHCCINWLTHMRSVADQQLYTDNPNNTLATNYEENQNKFFLPFIDEQCIITLPVFDYRNPKTIPLSPRHKSPQNQKFLYVKNKPHERIIGQLQIRFVSRVYQNPIAQGYKFQSYNISQQGQPQNKGLQSNKGFLSPNGFENPSYHRHSSQINAISLRNLLPDRRFSSNTIQTNYLGDHQILTNLQKQGSNLYGQIEKSQYFKQSQNTYQYLYKQNQNITSQVNNINQLKNQNLNKISSQNQNYSNQKVQGIKTNQLQLLQLKLQAQDFFNMTKSLEQQKRQKKMILNIFKLKTKIQNIHQLDIFIGDIEEQFSQNIKNNNKKLRFKIYRIETDKFNSLDFFKSKLIVDNPSHKIIEVYLPNNQGKCSFRCKDLSQTQNDFCVYSKGTIVGVLTVKNQNQSKIIVPNKDTDYVSPNYKPKKQEILKEIDNKICIIMIDNFMQNFHKKYDVNEISNLDNYFISIKNINFYNETLKNSKLTGQYAITNSISIPKIFVMEVKSSGNELVGMSESITFEGNQVKLVQQNIMPTLILQKNISINLKQMPIFKKIPNSLSLRLSIYICNTNQLNYFINKWKQNIAKNRMIEAKRQKSYSNVNKTISVRQQQRIKQKQYTMSDEVISQVNNYEKRLRTQSQNKNKINANNHTQSKSSGVIDSDKSRFKTHVNYTEDLKNRTLNDERPYQMNQNQEYNLQNSQQQDQNNEQQQQDIYLVQFFCKSLHYLLSKLGSKKFIQQKLTELSKFHKGDKVTEQNKRIISKQQFQKILQIFIGNSKENHQQFLGFEVQEILSALFVSQDGQMIKIHEFTLCLMAYYNFLLLLTNQKLNSLQQIFLSQPDVQNKLTKIKQSMTNISSEFLWQDVLPNVLQKTKKKINKRYRIYSNTPFSVNFLLNDLILAQKNKQNSSHQSFFINLLNVLIQNQPKKEEIFMRTTADLGNLVRQTVEQIIIAQCLKDSSTDFDKNWFQKAEKKMQEYILKENLDSISSEHKDEYCFNLTQFQEFFKIIGIETSIWQSLMLIEEIKVWYHSDELKDNEYADIGQGVITYQLLKSWFKALKFKIQIKRNQNLLGQKIKTKSSRLNSIQSIDSQEQNIFQQMNKKEVTIKKTKQNQMQNLILQNLPPKSPMNRVSTQQNPSQYNQEKYLHGKRRMTEKNSMRESQSVYNESDVANIANLLRENEKNLYFLPSIANEPNTMNRIISVKNISESDILKGLDSNTLRNQIQALPTKKTNIVETNRIKDQKIDQSEQYTDRQSDKNELKKIFKKIEPIDAYLSITLKQLKLKKKQIVKRKQGLKRLILSLGQIQNQRQNIQSLDSQNRQINEYFFMTQENIRKIIDSDCSVKQIGKYSLKNIKIDINNVYDIETTYSQGFSLKLFNLTALKNNISGDKVQQLLVSGILPVEDIINVVQECRVQFQEQKQKQFKVCKRKTVVLYSGRELNGKAVLQISLSNKIALLEIPFEDQREYENFRTIEFSFLKKELFNKVNKQNKKQQIAVQKATSFMSLSYCSIRRQDHQIEILPRIQENKMYQINLPEPIIEYQLILHSIQSQLHQHSQYNGEVQLNSMSISRFTQLGQKQNKMKADTKQKNQQCIIPLQTLYFKKNINSEYPLVDKSTGRFICTIDVNLKIIPTYNDQTQHHQGNN